MTRCIRSGNSYFQARESRLLDAQKWGCELWKEPPLRWQWWHKS